MTMVGKGVPSLRGGTAATEERAKVVANEVRKEAKAKVVTPKGKAKGGRGRRTPPRRKVWVNGHIPPLLLMPTRATNLTRDVQEVGGDPWAKMIPLESI